MGFSKPRELIWGQRRAEVCGYRRFQYVNIQDVTDTSIVIFLNSLFEE